MRQPRKKRNDCQRRALQDKETIHWVRSIEQTTKALAQADPAKSVVAELSIYELRALLLLKRKYAKKTEIIPDDTPTIEQAVRWLAELGGYTGKSSGGPPGAVTLRRGLEFVAPAAIALELLEAKRKMR